MAKYSLKSIVLYIVFLISKLSETTLRSVYTGETPILDIYFSLGSQVDTSI